MLTTEMHTRDIPALYQRFAQEIGPKHWRNRVAQCHAEIRGNDLLGEYLRDENSIAFQLDHLAELLERYGSAIPIQIIENPVIYPAASFALQIVSLIDGLGTDDAERIRRRVHGAFRNPDDMRGLCMELQAATHFIQLGLKVSWPETSGIGTFDLLVEGIGRGGLEVECKSISTNKGHRIHKREAIEFWTVMKPHLDRLLDTGLTAGLSIVVTLPGRLPKAAADRVALSNEVISALYGGALSAELASGASIRITHFEPAAFNMVRKGGDRRALRRVINEISGTYNRESMIMGSRFGGVLMLTIQSALDDEWQKAVFDTLSDAAKKQLTGTRAGLLLAALNGLDYDQLRSIALDDRAGGRKPSEVQDGVSKFLNSTSRDHVIGVGFVSRSGILSDQGGIVRGGGSAYYFHKKQSAFWSNDFQGLYSWSED